ncbi:MAG: hypothetical protein AB8G22_14095 [Saprospiraceae bacterium]
MHHYQFISKANALSPRERRLRKNKHRRFYHWKIERLHRAHLPMDNESMDVFPSSSEKRGIQLIKTDIIKAINTQKLFDFTYYPALRDFLRIINPKDTDEYLNLFRGVKEWEEEVYVGTLRETRHEYKILAEGIVELPPL